MQAIRKNNSAFTLIELLVVIAIIAALVGLLSVGLRQVKIKATDLKQKGEFHGMEVSIELFQNEFNGYPDSDLVNGGSDVVVGAQRLAEAMEGRDERGFHPRSRWHPDLDAAAPAPHPGANIYTNATLTQRKPVYFELKHSGMYTPLQLWGSGNTGAVNETAPLLTDVFVRNEAADTTVDGKVGMPVLYFKADPTKRFRVDAARQLVNPAVQTEYKDWIYDFDDNISLLNLPWLRDPGSPEDPAGLEPHYYAENQNYPGADDAERFYEMITQRTDTNTNFYKPYNADKYILISAGWDGIYGTDDDLTNYNY